VRTKAPFRPKLDEFTGVIDAILASDKDRPKKQRHTSKRIFERLRDEHGFTGQITIVKDYVAGWRQRTQEMFVPLVHPPGHGQADFGEAIGVIAALNARSISLRWTCRTPTRSSWWRIRPRRQKRSATGT
jgi:transposase